MLAQEEAIEVEVALLEEREQHVRQLEVCKQFTAYISDICSLLIFVVLERS